MKKKSKEAIERIKYEVGQEMGLSDLVKKVKKKEKDIKK